MEKAFQRYFQLGNLIDRTEDRTQRYLYQLEYDSLKFYLQKELGLI